jgi:tripartite-type tricarboxylate transporter receptor subunit TctC
MCGPAGLASTVLSKLNSEVVRALGTPDVQRRFAEQGIDAAPTTPDEFATFIRSETARWARVVKESGATAD